MVIIEESHGGDIRDDEINQNDVCFGCGDGANNRAGNRLFLALITHFRPIYVNPTDKEKKSTGIPRAIVEAVRNANPPGRFLKKHPTRDVWHEIGDRKAWEKTSQTLRDFCDNWEIEQKDFEHFFPQQEEYQGMPLYDLQQAALQGNYRSNNTNFPMSYSSLMPTQMPLMHVPVMSSLPYPQSGLFAHNQPAVSFVTREPVAHGNIGVTPYSNAGTTGDGIDIDKATTEKAANNEETTCAWGKADVKAPKKNTEPSKAIYARIQTPTDKKGEKPSGISKTSTVKQDKNVKTSCSKGNEKTAKRKGTGKEAPKKQKATKKTKGNHLHEQQIPPTQKTEPNASQYGAPQKRSKNEEQFEDVAQSGTSGQSKSKVYIKESSQSEYTNSDTKKVDVSSDRKGQVKVSKEDKIKSKSRVSRTIGMNSTETERRHENSPKTSTEVPTSSKQNKIEKEQSGVPCILPTRSGQDLISQSHFNEFQTVLSRTHQERERERINGSFSSERLSLLQELSKWSHPPTHDTVNELQAHLFGYPFYQQEQQPSSMSHLLGVICKENNISPIEAIHMASSKILLQSNLDQDASVSVPFNNSSSPRANSES
uniref:DUF6824 domain-containing protein n=1 Tax=Ditylum brightwellii TaxID=49249 RepID=A0A6V2A9W0_9STRA